MTPQRFVAIVDDDDVTRELIDLTLQSLQIAAVAYADAQAFLDDRNWRQCVCLILDVRMPRMSGIELQRQIKHDGLQIPIIFMTAHADVRLVVSAMRDGAVDFLQKPVNMHELVERVQRCLRESEQRRSSYQDKDILRARLACLTPREREVFDQIVA
ncbi:MAG: response regulator, partial [Burkholderiales bacterium]|nr:response regulator [Burkholderiales bacterium]